MRGPTDGPSPHHRSHFAVSTHQNSLFPPDPLWDDLVRAAQAYSRKEYGRQSTHIALTLSHGNSHRQRLPLLPDAPPAKAPPEPWASGPVPKHLSDFQLVYWPGLGEFRFPPGPAKAVKLLWEAWEGGTRWVGQKALLAAAESHATRCADLFSRCGEAWGVLILRREGAMYALPELKAEETPEETRVVRDDE